MELMDPMIHCFSVKWISLIQYDMLQNKMSINSDAEIKKK